MVWKGGREATQAGSAFRAEGGSSTAGTARDSGVLRGACRPQLRAGAVAGPGRLQLKHMLSFPRDRAGPVHFLLVPPVFEMSVLPSSSTPTSAAFQGLRMTPVRKLLLTTVRVYPHPPLPPEVIHRAWQTRSHRRPVSVYGKLTCVALVSCSVPMGRARPASSVRSGDILLEIPQDAGGVGGCAGPVQSDSLWSPCDPFSTVSSG